MDKPPGGQHSGEPRPTAAEAGAKGLVVQVGSGQALASCKVGRGARPVLERGLTARVHRVWAVLEWGAAVLAWVPAQPWLLVRSLPSLGLGGGGEMKQEEQGGGWVSRGCPPSSKASQLGLPEVPQWAQWRVFLPAPQDSEVRWKSQGWRHLPCEPEAEVPALQQGGCRWRGGPQRGLLSVRLGVLHHQRAHHAPAGWDHLRH